MDKIDIINISKINKDKLLKFYHNSFNFEKSIIENFNWRYRMNFGKFEPLALIVNNQLSGHAGLIPIKIKVGNKIETAIWFTDFFIMPKYRSRGYGKILTEEWMKICPIQITLCNNNSLRIFKKCNWKHNKKFSRKLIIQNFFNLISTFRMKTSQENINEDLGDIKLEELNSNTISKIINVEHKLLEKKTVSLIRDENWFKWRVLECPYKKNINIFKFQDTFFIVNLKIEKKIKILKIIYSSKPLEKNLINLFSRFARKNNVQLISYISNNNDYYGLNLPWNKRINFAFFSKNLRLKNLINDELNDIQFIDSDIDYI